MNSTTAMTESSSELIALEVDVQLAVENDAECEEPPSPDDLTAWAQSAYHSVDQSTHQSTYQGISNNNTHSSSIEVTIRLVGELEIIQLNKMYRGKDQRTNVLSFPFELDEVHDASLVLLGNMLGDIVICHQVVVCEAQQQNKSTSNHYAHMVAHGLLHLCGYDHENDLEADAMETLEIKILAQQGIDNPYA